MSNSPYKDIKQTFFRNFYELALPYEEYLKTGTSQQQEKWQNYLQNIDLKNSQCEILETFKRKMPVLVMSGIWCGDCARQGPMFKKIEEFCPLLNFRFIDNKQNPELQDELRINGAEKVPVVVSFSEDFYELNRFGDRHLSIYRRKISTELGVACDAGLGSPKQELEEEMTEWICHFERLQAILRLSPALRKKYND